MTWIDVLVVGLLLIAAVWGGRTGLIAQVVTLAGVVLGVALGIAAAQWVAGMIAGEQARVAAAIVTLFVVVGIAWIGATMLGSILRDRLPGRVTRGLDASVGVVSAVVTVGFVIWLVVGPIAGSSFSGPADDLRRSYVMRIVQQAPPPAGMISALQRAMRSTDFPMVVEGITAAETPSTPPDPNVAASRSVTMAAARTVRVLGEACGRGSAGSGWVFAPGYVATNAHVVAGVDDEVQVTERVETARGERARDRRAEVVAFDPNRDVAVLHVPRLQADPLDRAVSEVGSDETVAVIGYPENGPLSVLPAKVTRMLDATGRDIYDDDPVRREVYEVAAKVRPGNSGGPLVSSDGAVQGMVFAASTTNSGIGYALTAAEIARVLDPSVGRTTPVDAGACV